MIKIDTKTDLTSGAWKEFKPGVSVKLKPCTRKDYRAKAKAAGDDESYTAGQALTHTSILEWKGVVDQDNNPLPCTPAMIDTVCELVEGFEAWVINEASALLKSLVIAEEAELKN